MTFEQIIDILSKEFSSGADNIESIDLLGGEPLLNFKVIPPVCEYIWKQNQNIKVFSRTNGTLLTEEMKHWFSNNKGRISLGLSIDGIPEVNAINRGVSHLDIDFFQKNWPDKPVKMTIFPDSVQYLSESIILFYSKNIKVIGGLAQGVNWSKESCKILKEQLDVLCDYYMEHSSIEPLDPLFDFDFSKAFWIPSSVDELDIPCWERADIHTYDCDGEMLPCQMFSTIVQGPEKRKTILADAKHIHHELLPDECMNCPIRWCCKNCMALNYQHTGDFKENINLKYMCTAQKIVSLYSAKLLVNKAAVNKIDIFKHDVALSVQNAIKYLQQEENILCKIK